MEFKTKDFTSQVEDIQGRTVKTVWSSTSIKDLDNDVIIDTAFNKTISERSYQGANLIYSLIDHKSTLETCLGKPKELYVQNQKLYAVTEIVGHDDIVKHYQAGTIDQHSIGFSVPKGKQEQKDGYNEIREVKLFEGSAVLWGANPDTPTVSIKSLTLEQANKKSFDLFAKIQRTIKLLRTGTLTDDSFELLEISLVKMQAEHEEIIEAFFSKSLTTDPSPDSQPNTPVPEQANQIIIWTACQMLNN